MEESIIGADQQIEKEVLNTDVDQNTDSGLETTDSEKEKVIQSVISENLTESIWKNLNLGNIDPKQMSPLVLAYIGDGIYDLVVRTYLLSKGNMQVNKINKHACSLVKAQTQSEMIGVLEPMLNSYEEAVYKRGRNAKSYTSAKNATISDYRRATGFEALMGYLYLSGRYDRMTELISQGLREIGEIK